jgi:hypothetical protein
MKIRSSIALVVMALLASCMVAAAAVVPPKPLVRTTPHWNNGNQIAYFNKQGKQERTPTRFAQIWGDASLGG